jgi:glycosyltransferase involved in cell wall biosynthesis
MPQKEDAGMAPLEAMSAGLPVFGQAAGGLLESNLDGVTGRFFPEETDESFESHFLRFHAEVSAGAYDQSRKISTHVDQYDQLYFEKKFRECIEKMTSAV